jgi:hypothetical protein
VLPPVLDPPELLVPPELEPEDPPLRDEPPASLLLPPLLDDPPILDELALDPPPLDPLTAEEPPPTDEPLLPPRLPPLALLFPLDELEPPDPDAPSVSSEHAAVATSSMAIRILPVDPILRLVSVRGFRWKQKGASSMSLSLSMPGFREPYHLVGAETSTLRASPEMAETGLP